MFVVSWLLGGPVLEARAAGNPLLVAGEFVRVCASTEYDQATQLLCLGYVNGAVDGLVLMNDLTKATYFCQPPGGVENQRIISLVETFLARHPERAVESPRVAILGALREKFPCTK